MSLRDELSGIIPGDRTGRIIRHVDLIGDVAILSLPPEHDKYKKQIAEAILSGRNKVKTVIGKASMIKGDDRVPAYEVLAGGDTIATYREFGYVYRFDVTRVFFNANLGSERHRVALQCKPGETVLAPFSGVGPFIVPVAAIGGEVLAVEKNPEACRWLKANARLNGVEGKISVLNADALRIPAMLRTQFDRAILPAPYGMDEALDTLLPLVKTGGMLHFYTFKKKHQIEGVIKQYEGMDLEVTLCRRCGNVAPAVSRWAFDLRKKR